MIIIEVLDRSGKVAQRSRHDHTPVLIGRSYHNDVILDDPYVSPEHAVLVLGENDELLIVDHQSDNGLILPSDSRKVDQLTLGPETMIRIGRTTLRLRKPDFEVAPTTLYQPKPREFGAQLNNRYVFLGTFFLTAGLIWFQEYLSMYTKPKPTLFLLGVVTVMGMLLGWGGLWALASKVYARKSAFFAHTALACLATILFLLIGTGTEYYAFAFSAERQAAFLSYGGGLFVLVGLFYGHLRWCSIQPARRQAFAAGGIALSLVIVLGLSQYVITSEFTGKLPYSPVMKPLAFKMTESVSLNSFLQDVQALQTHVDHSAQAE